MFPLITINLIFVVLFALSCTAAPEGSRIVGGDFAEPGQFPHQVYLTNSGRFICGGSIYNQKYIITAAHCVVSNGVTASPNEITVVAGTTNLKSGGAHHSVKRIIPHENYGNFLNDIALLELSSPLVFNKFVQPIELHNGKLTSGENVVISGFGRIYNGGPVSDKLKYNKLTLLTQPDCGKLIGMKYDGLICIDHTRNNGACNGDSGGPAVINGKLVGVANFVMSGCASSNPDGYASVPFFVNWIKKNTSK